MSVAEESKSCAWPCSTVLVSGDIGDVLVIGSPSVARYGKASSGRITYYLLYRPHFSSRSQYFLPTYLLSLAIPVDKVMKGCGLDLEARLI